MFIYNVTVSIDPDIKDEWLHWMRTSHIPQVLETNCFIECRLARVHGEEEGGETYAVTYVSPSEEIYEMYKSEFAPALQRETQELFNGKFAAFRTTLTVIEEFKR